jgi:4-hydroxy-tetrahydrodipicolinate synthase
MRNGRGRPSPGCAGDRDRNFGRKKVNLIFQEIERGNTSMRRHYQELNEKFKGIFIVTMASFTADNQLDEVNLKKNVRFLVDKCKGEDVYLVTTGSTGEFYALSDEEWKKSVDLTIEAANGELPVIVGTMQPGTDLTIARCKYAESAGADGVMIVHPYYHIASTEGLYNHYKAIAESIPNLGIMIYNNDVVSKMWVDAELMGRLAKIPNIVGCKENCTDIERYRTMTRKIDPKDMKFIYGMGEPYYYYAAMHDGCPGFISGPANFCPEIILDLYHGGVARDAAKMTKAMAKIDLFNDFTGKLAKKYVRPTVFSSGLAIHGHNIYQAVVKEAMNLCGLSVGKVRLPMDNMTAAEIAELKEVLVEMGVL